MMKLLSGTAVVVSMGLLIGSGEAWGIPGMMSDQAAEWVRTNPELNPGPGETFLINRTRPDGSRFSFQASIAPPGRITNPLDRETIRSHRMTFYDPNGLTAQDLEQAIQRIYGDEIAADLQSATEAVRYPSADVLNAPVTDENQLQRAIQGVVRQGSRFVYWLELTQNPDGQVQQGQVVVFEAEWLPKIQSELAQRHNLVF
jgi:hypothetical protein